jgi:hypothetical protein
MRDGRQPKLAARRKFQLVNVTVQSCGSDFYCEGAVGICCPFVTNLCNELDDFAGNSAFESLTFGELGGLPNTNAGLQRHLTADGRVQCMYCDNRMSRLGGAQIAQ